MRGGQLDRRVSFLAAPESDDPVYGPQVGDFAAAPGLPARIPAQVQDDLPGQSESVQGGLDMTNRPSRVRMRYMRGIVPSMRMVLHDETDTLFEITGGPAEIGRREWIEITVKAFSS